MNNIICGNTWFSKTAYHKTCQKCPRCFYECTPYYLKEIDKEQESGNAKEEEPNMKNHVSKRELAIREHASKAKAKMTAKNICKENRENIISENYTSENLSNLYFNITFFNIKALESEQPAVSLENYIAALTVTSQKATRTSTRSRRLLKIFASMSEENK